MSLPTALILARLFPPSTPASCRIFFADWLAVQIVLSEIISSTFMASPIPGRRDQRDRDWGLDPNKLSYFYGGLDQKLVGVEGAEPIKKII